MILKISSILLICTAILSCLLIAVYAKTGPTHDKVVVCYLATWATYRPLKGSYKIDNFDPNLCTHVVYAFAGLDITNDAIKSLDPWQDLKEDYGIGGYEKLTSIKKTHPHLKVSLALGGWNEGSTNYSRLANNPERRHRFVKQAVSFIRKYNFDGLDLDWEYPTQRGGQPKDKENFVLLVKELREETNKYNLLLTSAFGASKLIIDQAYDIKRLTNLLDYLHIMCYDYGGSWDRKVAPNAPLTNDGTLNIEYTIEYLLSLGAIPSKLVVGIPFYGRTFLATGEGNYNDPASDVGFQGPLTRENGFMGYNEVCMVLSNTTSGWESSWDARTAQAIAKQHTDDATDHTVKVVIYDSARSVANKMRYIVRQELAGAMVWSVDTDDFLGECEPENNTFADFGDRVGINLMIPKRINNNYPLLRTINEALSVSIDELQQEKDLDKQNEIPKDDKGTSRRSFQNFTAIPLTLILIFKLIFV